MSYRRRKSELLPKEIRFANEYLIDLNAYQAALRSGYSETTSKNAAEWINEDQPEKEKYKPNLVQYIHQLMSEKNKELIASQDEILIYLTSVLRGQSESEEIVTEFIGDGKSKATVVKKHPSEKERIRAAELLGKRHGLFTEKVNVDGNIPVVIVDDIG